MHASNKFPSSEIQTKSTYKTHAAFPGLIINLSRGNLALKKSINYFERI